jgi:hypothetical protein
MLSARPLMSSRSETISALSDLISATSGSVSSCIISRSSFSAASCSSLMAFTMMPMMRLSTVKVVTTMKEMKNTQA